MVHKSGPGHAPVSYRPQGQLYVGLSPANILVFMGK